MTTQLYLGNFFIQHKKWFFSVKSHKFYKGIKFGREELTCAGSLAPSFYIEQV